MGRAKRIRKMRNRLRNLKQVRRESDPAHFIPRFFKTMQEADRQIRKGMTTLAKRFREMGMSLEDFRKAMENISSKQRKINEPDVNQ